MVFVGCAAASEALKDRLAAGFGDAARAFFIVPISLLVLFGGFVLAAIANVKRPEAHKRLMLLATISIIPPAIAHSTYVVGGIILLVVQILRGPVSTTRWWYAVADVLSRFSG